MGPTSMTMQGMSRLIERLAGLPWGAGVEVYPEVEGGLAAFHRDIAAFEEELGGLRPERFAGMLVHSRETSTHYKWHLHTGEGDHFAVWLHEYKPRGQRGPGYAESVHNHRYGLTSLILRGGYTHRRFVIENDDDRSGRIRLIEERKVVLRPGSTYSLTADDFHTIADLLDGTVTIVVQHPAVRSYSSSVDIGDLRLVHHYPIETRYTHLRTLLA